MADWIVTVPKKTDWDAYVREVNEAADRDEVCLYRLPNKVGIQEGDRLFITYNGKVRGWQAVTNFSKRDGFRCTTTGNWFSQGWYIERSGSFNEIDGPSYPGFRGIRKFVL